MPFVSDTIFSTIFYLVVIGLPPAPYNLKTLKCIYIPFTLDPEAVPEASISYDEYCGRGRQ
jgi:hypothetical protein